MELPDGSIFSLPIYLAVRNLELEDKKININSLIILRDSLGLKSALMKVTSIYKPDLLYEC